MNRVDRGALFKWIMSLNEQYLVSDNSSLINKMHPIINAKTSGLLHMKYSEIVDYPRHWDQTKFPVVAHIEIESENLEQLERRAADQTQVRVLGHDEAAGGLIIVHVAATSESVLRRFESRWTT